MFPMPETVSLGQFGGLYPGSSDSVSIPRSPSSLHISPELERLIRDSSPTRLPTVPTAEDGILSTNETEATHQPGATEEPRAIEDSNETRASAGQRTRPQSTRSEEGESQDELRNQVNLDYAPDEEVFLNCLVDLKDTPDDYSNIYISDNTIQVLESNLYMSILRPDEFDYGVLKNNRVTGGMLFGPPGTGKTLLAQAVAKRCQLNMLCISPGNIFGSKWGDDERAIRAVFGLARKKHPCLMFIDEADGILGRRQENDQKYVRTMLSEFLREWDGAATDENRRRNPFVLLATNMPWDIDAAAVRRAPMRILIDVPTRDERIGILKILLKEEKLGDDVSIELLARLTRSFSGSDLKSLCVSAAMRCIQEQREEENDSHEGRRVLWRRNFEFALRYIKPSASDKFMSMRLAEFQRSIIV
ncbi:P-loop containing nucleoside triphosphate hydrolase protein [Podospora didyma]|uniref:P-loop containing nucleoside triphosphate hydrolase protein n=1 Tax=Podospora didyma TaxID=330526 RepID=A0AAE0NQ41_9PEZI|nr:P-loop containing nucleoside triphosphate hydrolase protein [Podospora didyma]